MTTTWIKIAKAKAVKKLNVSSKHFCCTANSMNYPDTFTITTEIYANSNVEYVIVGRFGKSNEWLGARVIPIREFMSILTKYQEDSKKLITKTQFVSGATSTRLPYTYIEQYEIL